MSYLDLNYDPIMGFLELCSLESRRKLADLVFSFKKVNDKFVSPELCALVHLRVVAKPTGNGEIFVVPFYRSSYASHS